MGGMRKSRPFYSGTISMGVRCLQYDTVRKRGDIKVIIYQGVNVALLTNKCKPFLSNCSVALNFVFNRFLDSFMGTNQLLSPRKQEHPNTQPSMTDNCTVGSKRVALRKLLFPPSRHGLTYQTTHTIFTLTL